MSIRRGHLARARAGTRDSFGFAGRGFAGRGFARPGFARPGFARPLVAATAFPRPERAAFA
ncbi:MAG TPA: hypothetical protein VK932_04380, partial [Kofleriaceae bacterium]|nr:hypothetical protein [Kofleriaceae bacterium]